MLLPLVHVFLHRLFIRLLGRGWSVHFPVIANCSQYAYFWQHLCPSIHTHNFCLPQWCPQWYVGWEKTILPCSVVYKIRVCRFKDDNLRNIPVEWGAQIQLHGIWTRILPSQGSFLLTWGFSAGFQVVEFVESPAARKMGLENDTSSTPMCSSSTAVIPFPLSHLK